MERWRDSEMKRSAARRSPRLRAGAALLERRKRQLDIRLGDAPETQLDAIDSAAFVELQHCAVLRVSAGCTEGGTDRPPRETRRMLLEVGCPLQEDRSQ
jgi:hypothetical protein